MWSAALKVLEKLLDICLFFLKLKKKKKAGDAFVDFAEINAIIKDWVHYKPGLGIERVLILRAHNGQTHKKLMPVGYKYSSVIANDFRAPFEDVRTKYQNVPQDNEYVAYTAEVYVKKEFDMVPATMNDGVLKNIYINEGVTYCRWYFLAHNEEELWFLSVATSQPDNKLNSIDHKMMLFLGVNRIRAIVKPYFK